jgi:hypothetical protein
MKSKEFIINVPINIKINGDGDPEIDAPVQDQEDDAEEPQQNPVMVNPLQQDLELRKAEAGKTSPVLDRIKQLISKM